MQENEHIDQFVWTKYNCTGLSDCPGPSQASNFPFCDNPDTIRFNRCLFALARHCQPRNYYLYYLRHHWNQFKDIKFTLVFVFFFIACRCVFHFFPSFFKYCNNNAFFFCVSRGELRKSICIVSLYIIGDVISSSCVSLMYIYTPLKPHQSLWITLKNERTVFTLAASLHSFFFINAKRP